MSASTLRTGFLVLVLVLVAGGGSLALWIWNVSGATPAGDVPSLISGLRSYQRNVRIASAASLATMGLDDAAAHDGLVAALGDTSESVRVAVADTLSKRANPKSAKPLVGMLKDSARTVRATAAFGLARIPDLEPADVASLMACFKDSDAYVRSCVFVAADVRARAAKTANDPRVTLYEPLVIAAIHDPDPLVRRTVAIKLGNPPNGSLVEANAIVVATAMAIEDPDSQVAMVAVLSMPGLLNSIGPRLSEPTIRAMATKAPVLIHGIVVGDRQTRPENQAALAAVGAAVKTAKIAPDDDTVSKTRAAFSDAFATPGLDVKPLILASLSAVVPLIKPDAKLLKEVLQPAIADPALHAAAVNATREILDNHGATDEAIGTMAVELLRPILKDTAPQVRGTAYTTLWRSPVARKVGGDTLRSELREVTKSYMADLADKDPATREVAAWCLSWTDPEDAAAALKALEAAKDDKEDRVKGRVTKAIDRLKAAGPPSASWPEPSWEPFRRGWGR